MDQGSGIIGFTADDLVDCYRRGVFPMADSRYDDDFYLVEPRQRGVIPLDGLHIPRRLARTVRADRYRVVVDRDFAGVIAACAASRPGRLETWINAPIERLYLELHQRGQAHSVEAYDSDGELAGGLYGVSLGGAFFGESMFSRRRDASKVALAHLAARLIVGGYRLLDTQFLTDHLMQFGTVEIDRSEYQKRLSKALTADADFYRLGAAAGDVGSAGETGAAGAGAVASGAATGLGLGLGAGGGVAGAVALQAISQAS
jgi:leucyl/phenylalanyl-tRNA--protein transferase